MDLFRALLQKNNRVLKGLIASLLHMKMEDIQSVIIKNEIILGKHIPDKAFILDIRVLMNDNSIINLEMQVVDQCNWVERSMSYLCRCFDNLVKGDDYINAKPVVQIGLLDYTLGYIFTSLRSFQYGIYPLKIAFGDGAYTVSEFTLWLIANQLMICYEIHMVLILQFQISYMGGIKSAC